MKHPKTVQHTRSHAVFGLFAVFLALVLRHAGQQVLDQLTVGILAEIDGGGFKNAARLGNIGAQFQVGFHPTRKAADIVDDDNVVVFAVLAQEGQHGFHTGPTEQRPGHIVLEHAHDIMPAILRIFAAARFLTFKPVAFTGLFFGADAAINNRFLLGFSYHGSLCLFAPNALIADSFLESTG